MAQVVDIELTDDQEFILTRECLPEELDSEEAIDSVKNFMRGLCFGIQQGILFVEDTRVLGLVYKAKSGLLYRQKYIENDKDLDRLKLLLVLAKMDDTTVGSDRFRELRDERNKMISDAVAVRNNRQARKQRTLEWYRRRHAANEQGPE